MFSAKLLICLELDAKEESSSTIACAKLDAVETCRWYVTPDTVLQLIVTVEGSPDEPLLGVDSTGKEGYVLKLVIDPR